MSARRGSRSSDPIKPPALGTENTSQQNERSQIMGYVIAGLINNCPYVVDHDGTVTVMINRSIKNLTSDSNCSAVLGSGIVVSVESDGSFMFRSFSGEILEVPKAPVFVDGCNDTKKPGNVIKMMADPADPYRFFVLRENKNLEVAQIKDQSLYAHCVFSDVRNFEVTKDKYLIVSNLTVSVYRRQEIIFDPLWTYTMDKKRVYLMDDVYVYQVDPQERLAHVWEGDTGLPKIVDGQGRVVKDVVLVTRRMDGNIVLAKRDMAYVKDKEVLRRTNFGDYKGVMVYEGVVYFWRSRDFAPEEEQINEETRRQHVRSRNLKNRLEERIVEVKEKVAQLTKQITDKMEQLSEQGKSLEKKANAFSKRFESV